MTSTCPSGLSECLFVKKRCPFTEVKSPFLRTKWFSSFSLDQEFLNFSCFLFEILSHILHMCYSINENVDRENKKSDQLCIIKCVCPLCKTSQPMTKVTGLWGLTLRPKVVGFEQILKLPINLSFFVIGNTF